ncbi:LexA family transcriptional regulator [Sodalis ligni]|uniref:HumD family translesion DNA polymerase n=1 Tax=Sodalis ligni TaxID=2697027 RepID=UPI00193FB0A9|nr:S24 family peptidase [Sodalis ligni]QWA09111.1 LexA family transcriptional regulator [Sodalis ligni]
MGFPSPAQDYIDSRISLDKTCILRPASTYLVRVEEGCMAVGILHGAILVVDAAVKAAHGSIVVAVIDGAYVIRRLRLFPLPALESLGKRSEITTIDLEEGELVIFGVVTFAINDLQEVKDEENPCL